MCLTYEKHSVAQMARRNTEGNGKTKCDTTRTYINKCNTSKTRSPVQDSRNNSRNQSPSMNLHQRTISSLPSTPKSNSSSPVSSKSSTPDKQYAGCKWSEPPSPASLPAPPLRWTQKTSQPLFFPKPFQKCQPERDISRQLMVLLNVRA